VYFIWRKNPRSVLGHTFRWIPGNEIKKRMEEVGCFTSAEAARDYIQTHFPAGKISVVNHKVFQQKIKANKLPQFRIIETAMSEKTNKDDGCLTYTEYLEKISGRADLDKNTAVFPSANAERTSETEVITAMRHLLRTILEDMKTLKEKEIDLKDKILHLDLVTSDRLHQMELCELPEEACIAYIAALKENLILRRRYKNELLAIQAAKESLRGIDAASVKLGLQRIDELGKQKYHCRVLTERDNIVEAVRKAQKGGAANA